MRTGAVSIASDALPPELVTRFKAALDRLNPDGGRIGLAVSGGPDSMAMLMLAHEAIPGGFEVATVNHGLRAEAADECALVARACAERGVECAVLAVEVGTGNVQAEAREARYAALCAWADMSDMRFIATAHHIDDQAETLLMRLNRGSGVAGLSGVQDAHWPFGFDAGVIRPLLDFRRSELAAIVANAGLVVAQDPSNADDRFDRVRIRKALAAADWIDPVAVARSASHMSEAYAALQDYAGLLWGSHVVRAGAGYRLVPTTSREMNRRLVATIMNRMGGRPRGGDVARLLDRLERGEGGNIGGVLATVEAEEWRFRPEPPRRSG
jgi:tRNA(Ile)-lysidine synthase